MERYTVSVYNNKTEWKQGDRIHRTVGPAIDFVNGFKQWFVEGIEYTEEGFRKKMNPVVEMTVDEISAKFGFTVKVVGEKP